MSGGQTTMKTALCLSGELRRIDLFFPIIKSTIINKYSPDIFISTWKLDGSIPTSVVNTCRNPLEISTIEYVTNLYNPKGINIHEYNLEIKNRLKSIGNTYQDNVLCMAFHIFKCHTLAKDRELLTNNMYDLVIRSRFDIGIKTQIEFEKYNLNHINIPNGQSYGGYQDQFAFGNSDVMSTYSSWFTHVSQIENTYRDNSHLYTNQYPLPGYPWHPESALKRYLDNTTIKILLIDNLRIAYPWCTAEEITTTI
jgi:hypothetical protein